MSITRDQVETRALHVGQDLRRTRRDVEDAVRSLTPVRYARQPRRWPWALGAAVLGAGAGAAAVLALRRLIGEDAPDAQEPGDLRAVVDTDVPAA